MAKSDENHMFVSHYHEDEEHIKGMKELLGDISKENEDSYKDELSKKMLTKEEFIADGKYKYRENLLNTVEWSVNYNQERLDEAIENMNDGLAFYERFKKEIEKL